MNKAELYEEIKTLLSELQSGVVPSPWTYDENDFVPLLRSALRRLRTQGVVTTAVIATDGTFTADPLTELEGRLLAVAVVVSLVRTNLMQKLKDGELGVLWKAGTDTLDTKNAARSFEGAVASFEQEYAELLAIALASADGGLNSTFGDPFAYIAQG